MAAKASQLKKIGVADPSLVGLILPTGFEDLSRPTPASLWFPEEKGVYCAGTVVKKPEKAGSPGGPPQMKAHIEDGEGTRVVLTAFGDTRPLQAYLERSQGDTVHLIGKADEFKEYMILRDPEPVPPEWRGRIRPVYPGKPRVVRPETVRSTIHEDLEKVAADAAAWMRKQFQVAGEPLSEAELVARAGAPEDGDMATLIRRLHAPETVEAGNDRIAVMDQLAARLAIAQARANRPGPSAQATIPIPDATYQGLLLRTKKTPSASQREALDAIIEDLRDPRPMRRMVAGDVGSGKTLVYSTAMAAAAYTGCRAAVMVPGQVLVTQAAQEIADWWPDVQVATLTAETDEETAREEVASAPIVVGTSALLHWDLVGKFDLVVVDEQHRFSKEQREQLLASHTNLLEVTATPIPRSAALMVFGGMEVSQLKPWATKHIETRVRDRNDGEARKAVFEGIKASVEAGHQVALIYPLASGESERDRRGAANTADYWEKHFPEQVAFLHGKASDDEKSRVLEAMRRGDKRLLVATTVIEVGVDLPELKHIVVLDADRFGLAQLHQIRGRVGRQGGKSWCDLVTTRLDKPEVCQRLGVLEQHTDGARIAWEDLRLRGFGALAKGDTQSGAAQSPLPGRTVTPDSAEEVAEWDTQPAKTASPQGREATLS